MDTNHHDETREMTVTEPRAMTQQEVYIPAQEIITRLRMVRELRDTVMENNVHFGVIPGTEKPALYQAGADLLRMMFNLQPQYNILRDEEVQPPHRGYLVHTTLTHALTGAVWGQGVGSCSTLESKYRWRTAKRTCPSCQQESISKSKEEYGGGFYCRSCKAKFPKGAAEILNQPLGKVENPDIADQYNTVLKLAKKRSFVDAILNATGAREKFSNVSDPEQAEDDDDLPTPEQQRAAVQPSQPPKEKKREPRQLFIALSKHGIKEDQFRAYLATRFEKESTKDLTPDEFDALLSEIEDGTVKQFVAMPEEAGE